MGMVNSDKKPKAYDAVVEHMLQRITEGVFQPGDRLPSERALSETFCVSRPTIREAIRFLESVGCVETRVGAGSYIKSPSAEQIAAPFSVAFAQGKVTDWDMLEARLILETEVTALAAQRRTPAQLQQLKQSLERMKADIEAGGDGMAHDEEFHSILGKATNNKVLSNLVNMCASIYSYTIQISQSLPGVPHAAIQQHQELLDAIEDQDAPLARILIKRHLLRTKYCVKK